MVAWPDHGNNHPWCVGLLARSWKMVLTGRVTGLNQFFFFRYPSVIVGNLVAQLISLPLGRGLGLILPDVELWGMKVSPGPFVSCIVLRSIS